ncbi:MAG TPA: M13 family metallopeptidase [Albitalea sp.]|uniref:M13 family metallopeptidase n=1 Tax=Piscinibacter sp. TaxID=1903157 RepID=UPI002ED23306
MTRRSLPRWTLAAALVLVAPLSPAADTPDQPLKALPYSPGLDLGNLDRSADACTDFYRFACGGWQQKNPIPPDQSGWDVYSKLNDENLHFLWGLLGDVAQPRAERTPSEQKTGDYFASCMDEAAIDAAGIGPLKPALERIAALGTVKAAAPLVGVLHLAGAGDPLFRFGSEQDFANSAQVIASADAGGLGLPDRDYYLKTDAKSKDIRAAYRAHIVRVFELMGESRPAAEAAATTVTGIETELAKSSLTREQRRDPYKVYHRMSLAQLRKIAPSFDWPAYLKAVAVPAGTPINVAQPAFFRKLERLLRQRPLADWKTYLRWNVVNSQAPYLAQPYAQAYFDFYSTKLRGVEKMPPRWKRCVRWVDRDMGEALGQVFVKHTFAPETKERAATMAKAIESAMHERIASLPWMSPKTKQAAQKKLATLVNKIGYPEKWRDYSALDVRRGDFFGNVERGQAFETRRQLDKVGKPVDRAEWGMTPPTVNAYYDAQLNSMNFPAGILQPPLFDPKMDDAPNYGNTGSTIGHELTHGFDDEGRQFDAEGNLKDWWGKKDAAEFNKRTACIVEQYSGYTVIDDLKINGRLTLGEDVADLGGTVLAYMAWKAVTENQRLAPVDGFTPEQRFFIGMAQWGCSNERPQTLRLRTLTDPHSPNRYRVNGVVANMPEFARAFSCKPGQPMVRAKTCKVW